MPISEKELSAFAAALRAEERSPGTVEKYLRDCRSFTAWLGGQELTKERASAWREYLVAQGYAPPTINSMLSAVNRLLRFLGRDDCKIKFLRVQKRAFREQGRELTRAEYQRLLDAARERRQDRLYTLQMRNARMRNQAIRLFISISRARRFCGRPILFMRMGHLQTLEWPCGLGK